MGNGHSTAARLATALLALAVLTGAANLTNLPGGYRREETTEEN